MAFEPSKIAPSGIVGTAVADAGPQKFGQKVNEKVTEVRIVVDHGYMKDQGDGTKVWTKTSTTFISHTSVGDYAAIPKQVRKGDLVKIGGDWSLETRTYQKQDGSEGMGVSVRYGDFEILESAAERSDRKTADAGFIPAPDADGGFGAF